MNQLTTMGQELLDILKITDHSTVSNTDLILQTYVRDRLVMPNERFLLSKPDNSSASRYELVSFTQGFADFMHHHGVASKKFLAAPGNEQWADVGWISGRVSGSLPMKAEYIAISTLTGTQKALTKCKNLAFHRMKSDDLGSGELFKTISDQLETVEQTIKTLQEIALQQQRSQHAQSRNEIIPHYEQFQSRHYRIDPHTGVRYEVSPAWLDVEKEKKAKAAEVKKTNEDKLHHKKNVASKLFDKYFKRKKKNDE